LDPLGACRMCIVEVMGPRGPMLQTACTVPVTEGRVVRTNTPVVVETRKSTLEFLLTNHPLDCPICDKGGECPLQDNTLHYGPATSHFEERKVRKEKRYPISPLIMLDQERCILCWRCTRYLEEWADDPQLGLFERGGQTVIDIFPGQPVTTKTSGNIIELCPVGALTNRVARFRFRPWEIQGVASICPHCPVGCNIRLDARTNQSRRIVARENMAVNDEWLCDKGRFAHGFVDHAERLTQPLLRKDGELQAVTWDEALAAVIDGFSRLVVEQGPRVVGGLGSAKISNEAAYLFQKFLRAVVGTNNVDHRLGSAVQAPAAGLSSIQDLQQADVVFLFGCDPSEEMPVLELFLKRAARRKGAKLIVAHPRQVELIRYGGPYLAYRPGSEVALLNGLVHIILKEGWAAETATRVAGFGDLAAWVAEATPQKTAALTGVDEATLRQAAQLLAQAQRGILLYGPAAAQGPESAVRLAALTNLALVAGQLDKPGASLGYIGIDANFQGVRDAGLLPNVLPGYQPVTDAGARGRLGRLWGADIPTEPGLGHKAMLNAVLEGDLSGLYVLGADPAGDNPMVAAALEQIPFLVVQDLFMTETAALAHVVLPAASFAEGEGTFTNLERRVQRLGKALRPPGESLPDWAILMNLANRWSVPEEKSRKGKEKKQRAAWNYANAASILAEMAKAMPIYNGLSWDSLGAEGRQWPADALPKTPRRFQRAEAQTPTTDGDYPFALAVGSLLYDAGNLLYHTDEQFKEVIPGPHVLMNRSDAERLGVAEGQEVTLVSPVGQARVRATVSDKVRAGILWMAESLEDAPAETLLNGTGAATKVRVEK
ncbi:MAG: NADH-quinone oxidoreductase subunit NuoG, partial [Anaerolineae bacterium]|nr:NADH-quinone oxidoreductase subunit NuoG [Anaerolineae bacterium]